MEKNKNSNNVAVIGLGMMGSTLARLLVEKKYRVTVWNRTLEKAEELVREGAHRAGSVAEAVAASDLVVVCVYDYKAAREILETPEVNARLAGKTVVQLSTGSPQEARESEAWAQQHGADYLDGAILAAPVQMGKPETIILVSGAAAAYEKSAELLRVFGGKINYLSERVSAASAMDLAVLSYTYGAGLGFFHGARIGEVEDFRADTFGALVNDFSQTLGELFKFEGELIQKGDFTARESSIRISIEATERILRTAEESGINTDFPKFAAGIFRKAGDAGYADEEIAALIKVFRGKEAAAA